jgi:pimeloyl-ACP methyl ester carboxylesterase
VLAHSIVAARSNRPTRYMLFLHGILGTRANWRSVARRFVEARPEWGAILVDLREHGDSVGLPGPHTLRAAAADLTGLEGSLAAPIQGAIGHSFGGKVVLEWLGARDGRPTEAWVIDASPSASRPRLEETETAEVVRLLKASPSKWPSRDAFIDALVAAGQPQPIAQWLAMNLRRTEDGGRAFGPDLDAIHDLTEDYARTDLWKVVESLPARCTLDVVIGGRSSAFSPSDRERMMRIADLDPRVSVHVIEQAGHWVHIDAPDAMVALLTSPPRPQR